jgi:hypothetical protein
MKLYADRIQLVNFKSKLIIYEFLYTHNSIYIYI